MGNYSQSYVRKLLVSISLLLHNAIALNSSIVISFEDRLEIIDGETTTISESFSLSPTINYIVSITSDGRNLFLSDYRDEGTTLFEVRLGKNIQMVPLVKQNSLNLAEGIAFDSTSQTLYFSDSKKRRISSISLKKNRALEQILTLDSPDDNLRDVAVDSCNRRVYWVNWNSNHPSIQFTVLDGHTPHQTFIDTNLTKPRSLIYDYWDLRLYWIDTNENHEYRIERASSDSSGRETLCKGSGNSPYDITVTRDHVYWSDWMNMVIWRIDKFSDNCQLTAVKHLKSSRPMGIASLSFPDSCLDRAVVLPSEQLIQGVENKKDLKFETPPLQKESSLDICQNYCIHGTCSVTAINFPLCHCQVGYSGSRCQNDLCHNYCLNRGICRFAKSDKVKPTCQCVGNFSGSRCQLDKSKSQNNNNNNVHQVKDSPASKVFLYGFILMSSTTGLLIVLLSIVVAKSSREKKRMYMQAKKGSTENLIDNMERPPKPETKKVSKSSGCAGKSSCSSVVDIEDCCQMTLCDTPCIDAAYRKPRRRGFSHGDDDKVTLLDNDSLIHKTEELF